MNKEDLRQYKMHPQRAKELTGVEAELYVLTFDQLQEVVKNNAVSPPVSVSVPNKIPEAQRLIKILNELKGRGLLETFKNNNQKLITELWSLVR